jgi:hypothetical protein
MGDDAAHGPAQHVDVRQIERVDEGQGGLHHVLDGGRRVAGGQIDTPVVEDDDVAFGGQRLQEGRIPVVDGAAKPHVHHQQPAACPTEPAVGETLPSGPST